MLEEVAGGAVAPDGFMAGSTHCGLKGSARKHDIGIIASEIPCKAAALFTTNQIVAAPVIYSREAVKRGRMSAIVVNSGNANACTGERGYKDAVTMAELTAKELNTTPDQILVASTGIIGHPLPMKKIKTGIHKAAQSLGNKQAHAANIAKTIMTTDLSPKHIAVKVPIGGKAVTIGAIAKGSGMISPNMATMLCFITTDAAISRSTLRSCLKNSVEDSFNQITVDGHMSTNDMVAILANGTAGNKNISFSSKGELTLFQKALDHVTLQMAVAIVKDGEGASKFVQIEVLEAPSSLDAKKIARSIADSPLVKTAINGADPNWGRIVSAAGFAGVKLDESSIRLFLNKTLIFKNGLPVTPTPGNLPAQMKKEEILIQLYLGLGKESTTMWTCDLSKDYIRINAEYHT